MDKQTRSLLAVGFAVVAVFMGVNVMVDREGSTNWLLFAVIFAALAFFFWWLIGTEERRSKADAEQQARAKVRLAEEQLREARMKAARPDPTLPRPVIAPPVQAEADSTQASTHEQDGIVPTAEPIDVSPARSEAAPVASAATAEPATPSVVADVAAAPTPDAPTEAVVEVPTPHAVEVPSAPEDVKPIPTSPAVFPAEVSPATDADMSLQVEENVTLPDERSLPINHPSDDTRVQPMEEKVTTLPERDETPVASTAADRLPVNTPAPLVDPEPLVVPIAPASPSLVADPAGGDDLTIVEGIGPYYRDILHAAGIYTFFDLSKINETQINTIISDAGARRSNTTATWTEQARMAAAGLWDELNEYKGTLAGGRARK